MSENDLRSNRRTSLIDHAISTASEAFDRVLVVSASDEDFLERIQPFGRILIHDLLCPLTPAPFLREMAVAPVAAAAAVTPVVDTVKAMDGDLVTRTVDRDGLRLVASPVVVDGEILAQVPDVVQALADLAVLVTRLRTLTDVALVAAPFAARRISDAEDLRVLALRRLA